MNTLTTIYERVAKWNSQRYERTYNHDLAMALLREEYKEFLEAEEPVEQLDALCDLVYVAFGIIWKLDCHHEDRETANEEAYNTVCQLMQNASIMPVYLITAVIDQVDDLSEYPVLLAMHTIISLAMTQMTTLGLEPTDCLAAVLVVCDSNDSKRIEKVASDVKANAKDKGDYYVPPTIGLTKLLEQANARYH